MTLRHHVPTRLVPLAQSVLATTGRLTAAARLLPDVVVIGGQRCGTTTLFKAMAEHPQLARPPVDKGTDYYSLHHDRGESWYRGRMPLAVTARLRARGTGPAHAFEACTYYLFHPFAMQRLAAEHPDVRLVVMLRDPVERAFSAYKHEFARGFEDEPDFVRALELEDARLAGEVERMAADSRYQSFAHRHHAYRSRGQFAEQLERVFDLFPREQVHVIDSEAFFADPLGRFAGLLEHLGLQPWVPSAIEQHNARPSGAMPDVARRILRDHYEPHDRRLAELLGRPPAWTVPLAGPVRGR